MSSVRLSQRRIEALKPARSAYDVRDTQLKGFGIRVLPSGAKRFFVHSQHADSYGLDGGFLFYLTAIPSHLTAGAAPVLGLSRVLLCGSPLVVSGGWPEASRLRA